VYIWAAKPLQKNKLKNRKKLELKISPFSWIWIDTDVFLGFMVQFFTLINLVQQDGGGSPRRLKILSAVFFNLITQLSYSIDGTQKSILAIAPVSINF